MKRAVFTLIALLSLAFILPSCSKSAYPRDPYRGASGAPGAYRTAPAKAKSYRPLKTNRVHPRP